MKRLLISFLLTFAMALSAKAICVQRNYRKPPVQPRTFHLSSSSQVNHGGEGGPSSCFLETSDSAQMLRTPVRRIISFIKSADTCSHRFSNYFNTLISSFPHVRTGFLSSGKSMLFPFHGFW